MLCTGPARAADGGIVREVRFVYRDSATGKETVVDSPSPQSLASKISLAVGQPYTAKAANDDLTRFITQHGMLCREVRPEKVAGGVRLVYVFERRQRAWTVKVAAREGAPSVSSTSLMDEAVKLRSKAPVALADLNTDRWAIVDWLRRRGYYFATVNTIVRPTENRAGYVDVTFEVDRGPKVQPERISIRGNRSISDDELAGLMWTREDAWYNSKRFVQGAFDRDVENIKRHYLAKGWEDVRVKPLPVLFDPERVRIVVRHKRAAGGRVVTRVRVSGSDALGNGLIRGQMVCRSGRAFSRELFDRDLRWLDARYHRAGFRAHPVDRFVEHRDLGGGVVESRAEIIFSRAREVVTIDLTLKRGAAGAAVVETIGFKTTVPYAGKTPAGLAALRSGSAFTNEALLADVAAIARYYTDAAGLDYALIDVNYARTAQGYQVRMDLQKKGRSVWARVLIHEGGRYHVRGVAFQGVKPVFEDHVRDRLRMDQGSLFTRRDLAADLDTIKLVFMEKGYADVKVKLDEARMAQPGKKVYSLVYIVTPGPLYYIDIIRPRGNKKTKPVVITREMTVKAQDRFDIRKIRDSERRLRNTQHFAKVEVLAVDSPRRDDGKRFKELLVKVEERDTRRLFLGVRAGSHIGVMGDIGFRDTNFDMGDTPRDWADFVSGAAFSGGGQTLGIALQPGSRYSRFAIQWTEPWLDDEAVELGLGAAYTSRDWDDYEVSTIGGSVFIGKRFHRDVTGFIGVRAHRAEIDSISATAPPEIWADSGEHNILGVSVGITKNTLDDRAFPTEGVKKTLAAEVIGTPFPSTIKLIAEGRWYWTVHEAADKSRQVISLWGDSGVLVGGELPVHERFYAGGIGSVRGFATHGISPMDNRRFVSPAIPALGVIRVGSGDPVGGQFLMAGGVEYHFPVVKDRLRGLVFLDAGSVAENSFGIGSALSELRVSTGIGLHFKLPQLGGVPIAIYIGLPLKKESGDETETLSFSLGVVLP
jgi:outer membrane protein assembly complex protein YaeT